MPSDDLFSGDALWALQACAAKGIPPERLLREAAVDPAVMEPPALQVPWPVLKRLLETAERLTGDPAFGLHVDFSAMAPRWGVLGQYILSQRTAREGALLGAKLSAAIDTVMQMTLEKTPDETFFRLRWSIQDPALRHLVDINLRVTAICMCHYLAREWHPVRLRLRDRPTPAALYAQEFRCPVTMGSEFDEMVVEPHLLDLPRLTYDAVTVNVLRPYFDSVVEASRDHKHTALWIAGTLDAALLQGNVPSFGDIARQMRTDGRTVRARLTQEGTTYRTLLEDAKSRHACLLLRNPAAKLDTVAGQLGFSGAPPFVRAFRRWLGVTPAEWRRNLRAPTPSQNPS